ncbi:hypothetical protein [Methanospirillum lacunae]|uniref:Methyltransferase n=1 Tax=Methanospirillum lacunae TaxID=668570 RepID=A0A2V2N352_9EURY|nr:hypothetical protein [Methanospirillum lacunae]PWR69921.1 hypothetical protein DK846_15915 [Methanospirillum lacunae]
MNCPVCGQDHICYAQDLISRRHEIFSPCSDCCRAVRDKTGPPEDSPPPPCHCGRAFIDDVYARLYFLLVDAGLFSGDEALSAVGIPLIDPGIFLRSPPFLPTRSLILISSVFDDDSAHRAYHEIPQISAILKEGKDPPGVGDCADTESHVCSEHRLLCGCDVRADLFPTSHGPVVAYKKQGASHIEFPHGVDPKIRSVETAIRRVHPSLFVDACSGVGTLGITGGVLGVHHIVLNDPWYAAAYFSGFNLLVNKESLGLDECEFAMDFPHLSREKLLDGPLPVAEGFGAEKKVEVFQGRMELLSPLIHDHDVLTVFDPFNKKKFRQNHSFLQGWENDVGGEVFIP